jgi:ribosome-associated toxin RatA of RatAB toxin-antitoxin module
MYSVKPFRKRWILSAKSNKKEIKMPTIESRVLINSSDVDRVYQLAKDVEDFPNFMPDIESVTIVKNESNGTVITDWVGVVKQFRLKMRWTEKDIWDDQKHTCDFTLVKGDFTEYSGKWTFKEVDHQVEFYSTLTYGYNIPLIGPVIKKVIEKKMQENLDGILLAIKNEAEKAG